MAPTQQATEVITDYRAIEAGHCRPQTSGDPFVDQWLAALTFDTDALKIPSVPGFDD